MGKAGYWHQHGVYQANPESKSRRGIAEYPRGSILPPAGARQVPTIALGSYRGSYLRLVLARLQGCAAAKPATYGAGRRDAENSARTGTIAHLRYRNCPRSASALMRPDAQNWS